MECLFHNGKQLAGFSARLENVTGRLCFFWALASTCK